MMHRAFAILLLLSGLAIFMAAPALAALLRRHPERRTIYRLSPLTLLSFVLWFALLAWAFTGHRDDAVISRYVAKLRSDNRLAIAILLLIVAGLACSLIVTLGGIASGSGPIW